MAGVPPFLGFGAKLAGLRAAIEGDMLWLAIVGIVFAVIGAFYYLRVMKVMYFDEPEGEPIQVRPGRPLQVVFSIHARSEEHTSELQSLMRISYAVFCLKQKQKQKSYTYASTNPTR